jgi:hypothetical protein
VIKKKNPAWINKKFYDQLNTEEANTFIKEWFPYGITVASNRKLIGRYFDFSILKSSALEGVMVAFNVLSKKFDQPWSIALKKK